MLILFLIPLLCVLDQLLKYYVHIFLQAGDIEIASFLKLTLVYNKGISWSLLTPTTMNGEYALIIGIIILLIIYAVHLAHEIKQGRSILPEVFIMAGALSNLIDRFWYSGVVDFILLQYQNYAFPVFNGADICIFIGFLLFVRKGFCNESC